MLGPLPSCKVSHRSCQGVLGRLGFARRPGTIREAASDNDLVGIWEWMFGTPHTIWFQVGWSFSMESDPKHQYLVIFQII